MASKPKKMKSEVWQHFVREDDKVICNHCNRAFVYCGNTTNQRSHLKICEMFEKPDRTVEAPQRTKVIKSDVWNHFVKHYDKVICNYCNRSLKMTGNTTNQRNHLKACKEYAATDVAIEYRIEHLDSSQQEECDEITISGPINIKEHAESLNFTENATNQSDILKTCEEYAPVIEEEVIANSDDEETLNISTHEIISPKKTPGKVMKSDVWSHFIRDGDRVICNHCNRSLKYYRNTTNQWSHLKACEAYSTSELMYENNDMEAIVLKADSPVSEHSNYELTPYNEVEAAPEQFNFICDHSEGHAGSNNTTNAILHMIAQDKLPLNTIEKSGFKNLIKVLNPGYQMPTRTTLGKMLAIKYNSKRDNDIKELQAADSICVTSDGWTDSNNNKFYLALCAHYVCVKDNKIKTTCLDVITFGDRHNAFLVSADFAEILNKWQIPKHKIVSFITDNSVTLQRGVSMFLGRTKHLECFSHKLDLVLTNALRNTEIVDNIVKKVKNIVGFFRNNLDATNIILSTQESSDDTELLLDLIQDCKTKRNSIFHMLERFDKLSSTINSVLLDLTDVSCKTMSQNEINIITDIIDILRPFKSAITVFSTRTHVLASEVIPLIFCLRQELNNIKPKSNVGKIFFKNLLVSLSESFGKVESHPILARATILDPRFKCLHFTKDTHTSKVFVELKKELSETVSSTIDYTVLETEAIMFYHHQLVLDQMARNEKKLEGQELRKYLSEPVHLYNTNPIVYWTQNVNRYPKLYKIALKALVHLGAIVPCEKFISTADMMLIDENSK